MASLESLRGGAYRILRPITDWLAANRIHPNLLTTIGFAASIAAALAFHAQAVRTAGFFILLGGLFDILDGRVARLTELGSKFGAFYDSTLDRVGEIAVFLGLLSFYVGARSGSAAMLMMYVISLAMAGSLMISYTRARAESLGLECRVGLMQRAERIVLLGAAALFFGHAWDALVLTIAVFLMALLTGVTVVQRIVWVYHDATGVPLDEVSVAGTALNEEAREPS